MTATGKEKGNQKDARQKPTTKQRRPAVELGRWPSSSTHLAAVSSIQPLLCARRHDISIQVHTVFKFFWSPAQIDFQPAWPRDPALNGNCVLARRECMATLTSAPAVHAVHAGRLLSHKAPHPCPIRPTFHLQYAFAIMRYCKQSMYVESRCRRAAGRRRDDARANERAA